MYEKTLRLKAWLYISVLHAMRHHTLQDRSKVKLLQWDSEPQPGRLICYSSARSRCPPLSEMTAGFQQAELFVTKQIVTNLRDKYRITRPPCFNPSLFCLLFQ